MNLKDLLKEIKYLKKETRLGGIGKDVLNIYKDGKLEGVKQTVEAIDNIKTTSDFDFELFKRDNILWQEIKKSLSTQAPKKSQDKFITKKDIKKMEEDIRKEEESDNSD